MVYLEYALLACTHIWSCCVFCLWLSKAHEDKQHVPEMFCTIMVHASTQDWGWEELREGCPFSTDLCLWSSFSPHCRHAVLLLGERKGLSQLTPKAGSQVRRDSPREAGNTPGRFLSYLDTSIFPDSTQTMEQDLAKG